MPDNRAVIETQDLTKHFGTLTALRSVSLRLEQGEFLTVFGRNGAGKTTFLKIVGTLIGSYRGRVSLFGCDLRRADESIRHRIGFVSHDGFLYADLSVLDNLMFYARLYRIAHARDRVLRVIEDMGLGTKTHVPARALSRGMKQRLSLGRAFLHEPALMLLDEPFTGLDEAAASKLQKRFAEFKKGGGSVVMATHDAGRGWQNADRVAVIDRGAMVYTSFVSETSFEAFHGKYREILSR